jgi:hypothetical protein
MRGPPTGFWGKLLQDEDRHVVEWHPLVDHCADGKRLLTPFLGLESLPPCASSVKMRTVFPAVRIRPLRSASRS